MCDFDYIERWSGLLVLGLFSTMGLLFCVPYWPSAGYWAAAIGGALAIPIARWYYYLVKEALCF